MARDATLIQEAIDAVNSAIANAPEDDPIDRSATNLVALVIENYDELYLAQQENEIL